MGRSTTGYNDAQDLPERLDGVILHGQTLRWVRGVTYFNDRVVLHAKFTSRGDDGSYEESMGVLTVNLPEHELGPDEILVKTWSENALLAAEVLRQRPDVLEDTGKRVPTGFVEAQVWRVKP